MTIQEYIEALNRQFRTGLSTEHSYRPLLQGLLGELLPGVEVTNEPQRIECGAPDFILTRKGVPVGYIEEYREDSTISSNSLFFKGILTSGKDSMHKFTGVTSLLSLFFLMSLCFHSRYRLYAI